MRHDHCKLQTALLSAIILTITSFVNAQYNCGIEGTLTDTSGGVVSGATVTVTNQAINVSQTVRSSAEGFYRVSALPPRRYNVKASSSGFKTQTTTNINVAAEMVQGVNVTLQPGEATQTVTVSAESAPQLQTENGNLEGTINNQEIHALPQYGRDPYELVRLVPGVFGDSSRQANGNSNLLPNTTGPGGSNTSIFQTENMVQISSAGQRISDNNFVLDGISANSLTWGGAAVVSSNQESVQEIQVVTNGTRPNMDAIPARLWKLFRRPVPIGSTAAGFSNTTTRE